MSKHTISTNELEKLKSQYAKNKTQILKEEYQKTDTLPTSETFARVAFDQLLAQEGCVGIRIYFGMDEDMEVKLVAVGVDKYDQDIRPVKMESTDELSETTFAISNAVRCPPICPDPPPADSDPR